MNADKTQLGWRINRIYEKCREVDDIRAEIDIYEKRIEKLEGNATINSIRVGEGLIALNRTFDTDKEVFEKIEEATLQIMKDHVKVLKRRMEEIFPEELLLKLERTWNADADATRLMDKG